jgi:hypothetical protein
VFFAFQKPTAFLSFVMNLLIYGQILREDDLIDAFAAMSE